MTTMQALQVGKRDLRQVRFVDVDDESLIDGQARLKLDLFGMTSNNITYAAMGGPPLGYWDFFPGSDDWGHPPCWGFATVVQSRIAGVEEGARYYGYFPIAKTLDLTPQKVGSRGFVEGASHRAGKAAVYNQYLNVVADPAYDPAYEAEQTLFRPLYATGWWAADCVRQTAPNAVVVSSASSKTALSMAYQLRQSGGIELVALTSNRNETYVRETALYSAVLTYAAMRQMPPLTNAVYVDFLGRDNVIAAAHRAIGPGLVRSILIGATDWTDKPGGIQPPKIDVSGPKPEFFFVPGYAAGRLKSEPELGAAIIADLRIFYKASHRFVSPKRSSGGAAIIDTWQRLASADADPRDGFVLSF